MLVVLLLQPLTMLLSFVLVTVVLLISMTHFIFS